MKTNTTPVGLCLGSAISMWWLFLWRSMLCSVTIGFVLGTPICTLACWLASLPVTVWGLRGTLLQRLGDYSLALVKN
jgi:hypothetical protein